MSSPCGEVFGVLIQTINSQTLIICTFPYICECIPWSMLCVELTYCSCNFMQKFSAAICFFILWMKTLWNSIENSPAYWCWTPHIDHFLSLVTYLMTCNSWARETLHSCLCCFSWMRFCEVVNMENTNMTIFVARAPTQLEKEIACVIYIVYRYISPNLKMIIVSSWHRWWLVINTMVWPAAASYLVVHLSDEEYWCLTSSAG